MPEVHRPVLADEPRSVDDPGLAGLDRPQQDGVIGRVVLEVGVLNDDDVACRALEPLLNGGALAAVAGPQAQRDVGALVDPSLE
jgi:hypothetical protein